MDTGSGSTSVRQSTGVATNHATTIVARPTYPAAAAEARAAARGTAGVIPGYPDT
jgi:hypothetical protein